MHQHDERGRGRERERERKVGGGGEERLQCYRTIERGIAESQDDGKGEREAQKSKESERQEWNEKLEKKDGAERRKE